MVLLGCFYLKKPPNKSLIPRTQQGSVSESGISLRSPLTISEKGVLLLWQLPDRGILFISGDIDKTLQELIKLTQISCSRTRNTVFQLRPNPISLF